MKHRCLMLVLVGCFALICAQADADRYCGIYAVYGAACSLDQEADFESLIGEEYVSGFAGSTTLNLLDAIESVGLEGTPVWRLSAASLKKSSDPLILHVTSEGQLVSYNHWLLFLGHKDGMAQIAEGEQGVVWVPLANVLARWDGVAIAVHKEKAPATNFNLIEFRQRISWLLLAAALFAPFAFWKLPESRRVPAFILGICGAVVVISIVRHRVAQDGFFHNQETLAYIDAAYSGGKFETMSMDQIKSAVAEGGPMPFTVIDARYEDDFRMGAIPGAINIPISANSGLIEKLTKDIDRQRPLVVYCQTSSCSFDRIVAILLVGQGFKDIRLCSGGWVDWAGEGDIQP